MKILIVSLTLLMVTFQSFGQRKSKVDPRDAQIDSLTLLTASLTLQLDSVSGELAKHSVAIDSVAAPIDSTPVVLAAVPVTTVTVDTVPKLPQIDQVLADSITALVAENKILRSTIDSVNAALGKNIEMQNSEEIVKSKAVSNLKQLKELLDAKIITEAEYLAAKKKYLVLL